MYLPCVGVVELSGEVVNLLFVPRLDAVLSMTVYHGCSTPTEIEVLEYWGQQPQVPSAAVHSCFSEY